MVNYRLRTQFLKFDFKMAHDSGSDNGTGSSSSSSSSGFSEKFSSKRSPNWSDFEIRTLCEFVKEHKAKLFGLGEEANKKGVNAAKKKHWELAAALISEKCATNRHWGQVRKKWKDLSYYARSSSKKKVHEFPHYRERSKKGSKEEDEGHVIELAEMNGYGHILSDSISSPPSSPKTPSVRELNVKTESRAIEPDEIANPIDSSSDTLNNGGFNDSHRRGKENQGGQHRRCRCSHSTDSANQNQHFLSFLEQMFTRNSRLATPPQNFTMSTYEKARLEIERDKYELQRNTARCLRDILREMRQIGAAFSRTKRRRQSKDFLARKRQRWRSESDSSV